jgi:integrase
MGRKRTTQMHLPRHMMMRAGSYYHVARRNGKQAWVPLGNDYGEALRQWAALEGESRRPALTVADGLAHYLDDRAGRLSEKTLKEYRAQSKTLGKVFGSMRLEDVTQAHVYTYLRKRGNVAGNRERDLLRAMYNHAANIGYTGTNPCQGMRVRNAETPRKRYVTDDELAKLVLAARPRFALLIQFLYLTGMRVGDAITLPLTAASEDGIRWEEGKTRKPRFVVWSDTLRTIWKQAAGARIGAQPLFLGQRGPYTLDGAESTWARVRERAGVANVTFHDLRRKAGSDLPLEQAQKLLGHTDPRVTKRIYHVLADAVNPVK